MVVWGSGSDMSAAAKWSTGRCWRLSRARLVISPLSFDDDDDSFDDHGEGEEETVFGVPPAQRLHQQAQGGHFRMHGENLFQDTIGIGAQMAMAGRVEESPTPWNNAPRE